MGFLSNKEVSVVLYHTIFKSSFFSSEKYKLTEWEIVCILSFISIFNIVNCALRGELYMQYNCIWWVVCLSCMIFQHNQLIVMHSSCYLVKLTVCCVIRFHLRLCWPSWNVSSQIREIHQPLLLTSEWRIWWNHAPILAGYWNRFSLLCHLLRQDTSCS